MYIFVADRKIVYVLSVAVNHMCMQFVAGSCGITCAISYMNTIHYTLVWNGSVFHTLGISRTEWNRGTASQFLDIVHIIYILCTHTHTLQIEQLKQQNAALQHECKVKNSNCEAEVLRLRTEVCVIRWWHYTTCRSKKLICDSFYLYVPLYVCLPAVESTTPQLWATEGKEEPCWEATWYGAYKGTYFNVLCYIFVVETHIIKIPTSHTMSSRTCHTGHPVHSIYILSMTLGLRMFINGSTKI